MVAMVVGKSVPPFFSPFSIISQRASCNGLPKCHQSCHDKTWFVLRSSSSSAAAAAATNESDFGIGWHIERKQTASKDKC